MGWLALSGLLWSAVALGHLWAVAPATLFAVWGVHGMLKDDMGDEGGDGPDLAV